MHSPRHNIIRLLGSAVTLFIRNSSTVSFQIDNHKTKYTILTNFHTKSKRWSSPQPDMEPANVTTENEIPGAFSKHNIYSHKTQVPHEQVWERILPSTFYPSSCGVDVSVTFTDIDVGVSELIQKCNLFPNEDEYGIEYADTFEYLKECFQQFTLLSPNKSYRVKIEPTRGQKGKKCPKWHADYVPLRLILALYGPGVNYASLTSNEYEKYLNACNYLGSNRANRIMEKESSDKIQ